MIALEIIGGLVIVCLLGMGVKKWLDREFPDETSTPSPTPSSTTQETETLL